MKQGKLIRRAVSAALAGCMMFTLSVPALAESTDALMQLSISGNRAASVLDAENSTGDIIIEKKVINPADYDNIVINNKYTFHYDQGQRVLTSTSTIPINAITIEVPDDVDVVLDGKEHIAVHNLTIKGAHDVTISSDNDSAIGRKAEITCTGKVTINSPGGIYAIGYASNADGTLIIHRANEVEIDASGSSRVLSGSGKADITCDGPVTIHGKKDGGSVLANADNFTYRRTDGADYVYFTSEDAETEAIEGSVAPIPADAPYSYLHIEKKTFSTITVKDGIAKAGEHEVTSAFNGQKVTVTSTVPETEDRKFDGWEVTKAPAGFTISADKLKQKKFSFIMPTGNVELTAHHSNKLEVSGGTAAVNGNAVDFARPGAAVTVTATDRSADGYQFDHWVVSSGDIGKTGDELKANPLDFTMPDEAVKLTAVYRAAVKVSNGTAQVGTESGETVYALKGDTVTVTGHDSNASFSKFVGWKLKKGSLTEITDADDTSLNFKVDAENGYLLDADGEKIKNETIKFTMPGEPVELSAVYSIPAFGLELPVIVKGGTINGTQDSFVRVKAGDKVTIKANTPDDENKQFCYWKVEEGTSEDFGVTIGKLGSETELGTEEITFIMPKGAVKLIAHWSASPVAKPDPDEPIDEDFGVEPAPMDTTGGAIAAVAVGGAAVWGGYEIATRVILNDLLPAGAAIPANRGQLALLIWTEKGKPEPAAQPAFADITDAELAKAAQWCTEQGTMAAKGDRFEPEGWTPKFKVIEVWNKAFPKQ